MDTSKALKKKKSRDIYEAIATSYVSLWLFKGGQKIPKGKISTQINPLKAPCHFKHEIKLEMNRNRQLFLNIRKFQDILRWSLKKISKSDNNVHLKKEIWKCLYILTGCFLHTVIVSQFTYTNLFNYFFYNCSVYWNIVTLHKKKPNKESPRKHCQCNFSSRFTEQNV